MTSAEQVDGSSPPSVADLSWLEDLPVADVVTVLLFGSIARGDDDERSDLDVMVVVEDRGAAAALDQAICSDRDQLVVPSVRTVASLLNEVKERPSFIAHLVDEGRILRQSPAWPPLRARLAEASTDHDALAAEVRYRLQHLEPFSRLERFRLSPVTVLSHLWAIARSVVIAQLLQQGVHEYSWRRAFDRYAELRPDLRGELEALKQLRPYYERARGRTGNGLPEVQIGTDDVRRLVEAVEQIGIM
ncbi:MAG: nucleotidyltransferase domain-containing protein [Actinomycetota bacterium]|nr:nucleotidyltransferase domain-containing protein [Actinomycetota bacterium]